MLDISWGELLLIGAVALIVIGPKELPTVLRTVGQWMTKLRRMANEFQGQFQEAMREAEIADLKKEVDGMTEKAKSYANFDPLGDVRKDIENSFADKPATAALDMPAEAAAAPETPAPETPALETPAEMAAADETPLAGRPAESGTAAAAGLADTPADVVAPVEAAMRAVAEVTAPPESVAAAGAPVASIAEMSAPPAVAPDAPAHQEPPVAATTPTPAPAPASSSKSAPTPAADDDDWPVPASFKEPLSPKRGSA
jgi:sec-independent protein translocase protein TatB